jgi:hypothetical protein
MHTVINTYSLFTRVVTPEKGIGEDIISFRCGGVNRKDNVPRDMALMNILTFQVTKNE